jgi:hypothetical protein
MFWARLASVTRAVALTRPMLRTTSPRRGQGFSACRTAAYGVNGGNAGPSGTSTMCERIL